MKKGSFFFLTVIVTLLKAQSIFNPGAVWHYDYGGGAASAYAKISYVKDSVVNNSLHAVLRLQKEGVSGLAVSPNHFKTVSTVLAHQTNSVVYIGNDTLYGMNFTIGTTWRLPGAGNYRCQPIITITDTGHTNFHGRHLKYLKVSVNTPSFAVYTDSIYDKIGYRNAFPYEANSWCYHDDFIQYPGALRCYSDNVINYQVNLNKACNSFFSLGLSSFSSSGMYAVYPNPAKEKIIISGLNPADRVNVDLYDAKGLLAFKNTAPANAESFTLHIQHLKPGIYYMRSYTNTQLINVQKLVIEPAD